jgi:polysaccharide biosynthesis protein PslJ
VTSVTWNAGRLPSRSRLTGLAVATLILTAAAAAARSGSPTIGYVAFAATVLIAGLYGIRSWRSLVALLFCVIWFIPIKRYEFPVHLPFDLEPYRVLVAVLVLIWMGGLLLDRRIRLRGCRVELPIIVYVLACFMSISVNYRFLESENAEVGVLKGLTFFLSFILVYFLLVSVTRTRQDLDFFIKVIVAGGAIVAGSSIVEYRTGYNVFDHISQVFPFLTFEGASSLTRAGKYRTIASAQHPIALAAALIMMIPLALYLGRSSRKFRWWAAAFLLGMGAFSTLSRTGVTMLLASFVLFWIYRPRDTKRLLPLLVPAVIAIFLVLPNALGTLESTFFPPGGLIADQQGTGSVGVGYKDGRLATFGPGFRRAEKHPFLGTGFGGRIIDPNNPLATNANIQDDQWMDQLLDTGAIGFAALAWVFIRSARLLGRVARTDDGDDGFLAAALAVSLVAFAVGMWTFDAFSFIQVTFLLFILLALTTSLLASRRDEATSTPGIARGSSLVRNKLLALGAR